jgi:outer membrane protein OmpA-like peptidoglycan-associated protein
MKKVMIGFIGCSLLAFTMARSQNSGGNSAGSRQPAMDTTGKTREHTVIARDTVASPTLDTMYRYQPTDTTAKITDTVISLADDAPAAPSNPKPNAATPAAVSPAAATPAAATAATANSATVKDTAISPRKTDDSKPTIVVKSDGPATDTKATIVVKNAGTTTDSSTHDIKTETIDLGKTDDQQKADAAKTDAAKSDAAKSDAAKTDQSRSDDGNQAAKSKEPVDTTVEDRAEQQKRELDRRWFIAPLTKFQFQDFAFLEKNRKGYLSDANNLPFFQRGNASFAASAYKNLTSRLSVSADIGLSFGHATNNDVLISQTQKKTYNLLNAALYYHLISPAYRLQPYVTVGFNDIINDKSYPSVPMGLGAKFNSRKVMVLGQVTYGQSVSRSVANTTMYSLGIYIPIRSKKQKMLDDEENSRLNKKDDAKKKDSAGKGNVTNNIYITINMDSILKAKGLLDDNGNPFTAGNGRNGRNGRDGADGDDDGGDDATRTRNRRKKQFVKMGLDDFGNDDYKMDSIDGKPVIRFLVYFEFNEYGLNSKAFGSIDKVIHHLQKNGDEFSVEIKGYTDSVGTDMYNNMLSRKRAKMVLDYMNSRGVPADLMQAKAYGSDSPVADNSDPNQAWLNRRAEIIVHKKEGLAAQ